MSATPCRMLVVTATAAVLSLGIAPVGHADEAPREATCASQAAHVAKAVSALARLTALFEAQKDPAAAKVDKAIKVKKAQLQRLARAQARLAECRSAPAA